MKFRKSYYSFFFSFSMLMGVQEPLFASKESPINLQDQIMIDKPQYLYKVISPDAWEQSQRGDQIVGTSIDQDFIHLAKEDQVNHVIEKFWKGHDAVILKLDVQKLEGRLSYETNPGGTTYYYHLYDGKIPLNAVVEVQKLKEK